MYSRLYLKDLIETNHVFMKLLEHLGKKQRNLIVQRKAKTKKKTSKSIYLMCSIVVITLIVKYLVLYLSSTLLSVSMLLIIIFRII